MLYPSIPPPIHHIKFLFCATLCEHDRVHHDQYFYFFQPLNSQEGYFRKLAALFFVLPLMVILLMERKEKKLEENISKLARYGEW